MTDDRKRLNRLMAEKVMGWYPDVSYDSELLLPLLPPLVDGWGDKHGVFRYTKKGWNPTTNIEQAMECLIKALQDNLIVEYATSGNRDTGECEVWVLAPDEKVGLKGYAGNSALEKPAEAIVRALKGVVVG